MRISIFGLLYILGCGLAKYDPDLPMGSQFDFFFRELSILARVTNAIALQASMIRGEFNASHIMGESLKANPAHFGRILEHDTSQLNSSIEQLAESLIKIKNATEKYYDKMDEASLVTRKLLKASRMEYDIDRKVLEGFIKKLSNPQAIEFMMPCKKEIVGTVMNFWKVMSNSNPSGFSTQDQQKSAISEMKSQILNISNCMDQFQNFYDNMSPVIQRGKELRRIVIARDMLKFLKANNSKSFDYSKTLDTLEVVFNETKKSWNVSEFKVFEMVQKVLKIYVDLKNPQNIPELNQTVGFGRYGFIDIDVRHPWFVKKISMGKSTENLVKDLEKFTKFGRYMDQLHIHFRNFLDEFDRFVILDEYSKILKTVETFNFEDVEHGFFNKSRTVYNECWKSEGSGDDNFKVFDKNIKDLTSFNSTISDILDWVNFTISKIDMEVVKSSFEELKKVELDNRNLEEIKESIREIGGFKVFGDFASRFSRLHELQGKFEREFKSLNSTKVDVTTMLIETIGNIKNSSMSKDLACLKTKNFDFSQLEKIINFLEATRTAADDDKSIEDTKKGIEHYTKMRKSFLEMDKYLVENPMDKPYNDPGNLVLTFNDSAKAAMAFGSGVRALFEVWKVDQKRETLLKSLTYSKEVQNHIAQFNPDPMTRDFWKTDPNREIQKLVKEIDDLRVFAGGLRNKSLMEMRNIFDYAQNMTGLKGHTHTFGFVSEQLGDYASTDSDFTAAQENADEMTDLNLDFARKSGEYQAAKLGVGEIRNFFDELFGLKVKKVENEDVDEKEIENSYLLVICISIPVFFLLVSCVFCLYGLTENGRRQYKNLYLYYFGKPHDFEKRWRYSLFMDRQDGQNALIEAVREINESNVREILRGGAYINVFSQHGNTCLHMATKRGYAEIVEILIKNGADRSLLNAQNRTPEQMLSHSYRSTQTDTKKLKNYEKIEKIYKKYEKKKFRVRVPEKFPWSSFHIFADKMTDDDLTNRFMDAFAAVATLEPLPTTTHYIVKTDADGILDIYSFELAVWILSGVIVVRDTWMTDCLKNQKMIEKDSEYLVEKIRYKDVVYDTVLQWSMAMAKGTMPYLYGVYVAVVVQDYPNLLPLASLITTHGGTILEQFPDKSQYNIGSRPYLHSHLGPLFIIHDGKTNLDSYKNDVDKMLTLFTEEEFVHFMLKREINVDKSTNPVSVSVEAED